jgi:hypothetical protein
MAQPHLVAKAIEELLWLGRGVALVISILGVIIGACTCAARMYAGFAYDKPFPVRPKNLDLIPRVSRHLTTCYVFCLLFCRSYSGCVGPFDGKRLAVPSVEPQNTRAAVGPQTRFGGRAGVGRPFPL